MVHEEQHTVDVVDSTTTTTTTAALEPAAVQSTTLTVTSLPDVLHTELSKSPHTLWNNALYRTCLAKQCLTSTPQQVLLQHFHHTTNNNGIVVLRPCLEDVIVLHNYSDSTVTATAKSIVQQMQMQTTTTCSTQDTTSWSGTIGRVVGKVSWTISKMLDKVLKDADDYEQDEIMWNEQNDDYVLNNTGGGSVENKLVGWDQPVVCVDLVQECIHQLLCCCSRTTTTTTSHELLALCRHGMGVYSLAKWIDQPYNMNDLDLIAHVLVEAGHAVFYQDYIVIGKNTTTQNQCEVAVALVKLKQALHDTERQLEEWTQRTDEYTMRAFQKKRTGDCKGALHELQKRKLTTTKMDHARASLLNLQQAHDALEMAQMQHSQVLNALQATASALKGLRQETEQHQHSVEDVDDLYDDLKEEYEYLNDLSTHPVSDNLGEDDELLEELKRLAVNDKVEKEAALSETPASPAIGTETLLSSHDTLPEKHITVVDSKQVSKENATVVATQAAL
jgi:Snf7